MVNIHLKEFRICDTSIDSFKVAFRFHISAISTPFEMTRAQSTSL
jgi:hypothetical protein